MGADVDLTVTIQAKDANTIKAVHKHLREVMKKMTPRRGSPRLFGYQAHMSEVQNKTKSFVVEDIGNGGFNVDLLEAVLKMFDGVTIQVEWEIPEYAEDDEGEIPSGTLHGESGGELDGDWPFSEKPFRSKT